MILIFQLFRDVIFSGLKSAFQDLSEMILHAILWIMRGPKKNFQRHFRWPLYWTKLIFFSESWFFYSFSYFWNLAFDSHNLILLNKYVHNPHLSYSSLLQVEEYGVIPHNKLINTCSSIIKNHLNYAFPGMEFPYRYTKPATLFIGSYFFFKYYLDFHVFHYFVSLSICY